VGRPAGRATEESPPETIAPLDEIQEEGARRAARRAQQQ